MNKKKYNLLNVIKVIIRIFTTKNWRGHRRSQLLQRLLNDDPQVDDMSQEKGKILGIINYESTSFGCSCHDLASKHPFYSFDSTFTMDMTKSFTKYCSQDFTSLKATITRICSIWQLLSGTGTYSVTLLWEEKGYTYEKRYDRTIKLN